MRQLPHLSHLFRLLPEAALDMAGSAVASMVTASGSALVHTVDTSAAPRRDGGSHEASTAAGGSRNGAHANGAGTAAVFLAAGAGPDPATGESRRDSTLRTADPAGSTGPVDPAVSAGGPPATDVRSHELVERASERACVDGSNRTIPAWSPEQGVPAWPEHHGSAVCGRKRQQRPGGPGPAGRDPRHGPRVEQHRTRGGTPALAPDAPIRAPTAPAPAPGMRSTGTHTRPPSLARTSDPRANEDSRHSPSRTGQAEVPLAAGEIGENTCSHRLHRPGGAGVRRPGPLLPDGPGTPGTASRPRP